MKKIIFLAMTFLAFRTFAQTESSKPADAAPAAELSLSEEKFAAIVQYTKGKPTQEFKDLILYDQTIEVPKNSTVKVITQKRCVAVFYEDTKVQTPKDKVSAWTILSGTARWICPEDKIEKVVYKGATLEVQNGEFLMNGSQVSVLRNFVRFDGKNLNPETLYTYKDGKFLPIKDQPDPYDLWKKQEKFPAPLESARLKMEKPQDPYITRIFLNVSPVAITGLYNHEWENHASDFNMDGHFFRLGTNFPWRNKSIFTFIEYAEGESRDQNNSYGPPPLGYKAVKFEATTLALGLRHSHTNSSSFYYYLGLTNQKVFVHLHPDTSSYYDAKVSYPFNLTAGGGYQKIFWAKNWISLMVGADLKITQSLSQGKVDFFNQPFGENKDPRSAITDYGAFVYLGPTFNF